MAVAGSDRPTAAHAAPPASAPPRMPPQRPGSRRRCRRRLGCVAPVPRRPATRRVERFGPGGQGTSAHRSASRPHKARAEVHGRFQRGSWLAPCPNPSLATRASPKSGSFPRPELCCLGGQQYYYPVRLPRHCPGLRLWPYTRASFRGYRPTHGCRRVSPVAWTTFAACCPLYAGAVPGCSRIQGPDCCLRPTHPGSARSVPHGLEFRRGRVQLPYGLQLCSASRRLPEISLPGSSGGLPGPDSHRLVASPCWAVRESLKNSCNLRGGAPTCSAMFSTFLRSIESVRPIRYLWLQARASERTKKRPKR